MERIMEKSICGHITINQLCIPYPVRGSFQDNQQPSLPSKLHITCLRIDQYIEHCNEWAILSIILHHDYFH